MTEPNLYNSAIPFLTRLAREENIDADILPRILWTVYEGRIRDLTDASRVMARLDGWLTALTTMEANLLARHLQLVNHFTALSNQADQFVGSKILADNEVKTTQLLATYRLREYEEDADKTLLDLSRNTRAALNGRGFAVDGFFAFMGRVIEAATMMRHLPAFDDVLHQEHRGLRPYNVEVETYHREVFTALGDLFIEDPYPV